MKKYLITTETGDLEWVDAHQRKTIKRAVERPVVGEALGCIQTQLDETVADAHLSGFKDIEFIEDDEIKGFFNCKAPNAERWRKYAEHCGYVDKNGQYEGKRITRDELESAERLIRSRYPKQEAV